MLAARNVHIKIEDCDDSISEEALKDYENGYLSVDIIEVEVKCNLFEGIDCLGGGFARGIQEHLETVDCNHMGDQAIDDYREDAQKYKDFLICLLIFIYLYILLFYLFKYLFIYLFTYLSIYLFIHFFIYLLIYLFMYLFSYLVIYLFGCLFLYLFMYLFATMGSG